MHLGLHNLRSDKGLGATFARNALILVLSLTLAFPREVQAISAGGAMGIPAVANLVAHIVALNMAMEDASRNPMDDRKRERVRRAVSLLPAAIIGVAMVFRAGKQLHDADLPVVQGMLGGFVDVSAPDRFNKFLKQPDKSLIPKTGASFPSNVKPADIDSVPMAPNPKVETAPVANSVAERVPAGNANPELVQLKDKWVANNTSPVASSKKPEDRASFGYDESNQKKETSGATVGEANAGSGGGSSGAGASSGGVSAGSTEGFSYDESNPKLTQGGGGEKHSPFLNQVSSELSTIESRVSGGLAGARVVSAPTAADAERAKESEQFFNKVKQSNAGDEEVEEEEITDAAGKKLKKRVRAGKEGVYPKGKKSAHKAPFSSGLKPKFWRIQPFVEMAEALLFTDAHAQCGECGGGGGGGGGNVAADILMGIAMIIAAIAPMVVAAIQAKADVAIAKINAETQIKTTMITADTSKFLANQQKEIALTQADIAKGISKQNNDAQTQRLDMQLAELKAARDDARQAEREKRDIEQRYNQQRIQLAEKQAAENVKLAKQTLNANLTQAGLVSGTTSKNTANSLSVSKVGVASSGGGAGAAAGAGGAPGSLGSAGAGLPGGGGTGTGIGVGSASGSSSGSTSSSPRQAAPTPKGPTVQSRLIAALNSGAVKTPEEIAKEKEQQELVEACGEKNEKEDSRACRLLNSQRRARVASVRGAGGSRGVRYLSSNQAGVDDRLAGQIANVLGRGIASGSSASSKKLPPASDGNSGTSALAEFRNEIRGRAAYGGSGTEESFAGWRREQSAQRDKPGGGHSAGPNVSLED